MAKFPWGNRHVHRSTFFSLNRELIVSCKCVEKGYWNVSDFIDWGLVGWTLRTTFSFLWAWWGTEIKLRRFEGTRNKYYIHTHKHTHTRTSSVGIAITADCIEIPSHGHLGAPKAFCKLGFRHLPWNMWPHGRSCVSTLIPLQSAHLVVDGTSTDALVELGSDNGATNLLSSFKSRKVVVLRWLLNDEDVNDMDPPDLMYSCERLLCILAGSSLSFSQLRLTEINPRAARASSNACLKPSRVACAAQLRGTVDDGWLWKVLLFIGDVSSPSKDKPTLLSSSSRSLLTPRPDEKEDKATPGLSKNTSRKA